MESAAKIDVSLEVAPFVNLAFIQNGLPFARNLRISNLSASPLADVACSIRSDAGVVIPCEFSFGEIPPGGSCGRRDPSVRINQGMLAELRDTLNASVFVAVSSGGEEICLREYPVAALAAGQHVWSAAYPELLCAFVLPNAQLVDELQAEAAVEIGKATGSPSLEGYQGGRKRVLEMCAAIYRAIQKRGICYGNPPASYGTPGQRLRLPDEIAKYKIATCIETSLLFAAVMEKCQLHPVLMLEKDHCYAGCHLEDDTMDEVVTRSLQTMRKRADLDEFVAVETTMATGDAPFNDAERAGRARLNREEDFTMAIDVVRSRENGILPLSLGGGFPSDYVSQGRDVAESGVDGVRDVQGGIDLEALSKAERARGRIEKWTQRLLDFTARNRLLNIPARSKQVLRFLCPDIAALEDRIAADEMITVRSVEESLGAKALEDIAEGRLAPEKERELFNSELAHHRLCVAMPPKELKKRLSDLYHGSKTELEESGVNTLFLAIGLLQWMEPGDGAGRKSYRAPILMVPVRLERASMAEGVKMYRLDEDTTINATLIEFLRTQFHMSIPGLDPLPTDGSGVDVGTILRIIRKAIENREGWEVVEEAVAGCFSFGKFVMWRDMTDRAEDLRRNPLVNHLVGGGGDFDDGIEVFRPDEVADHVRPGELYCPVSADSSQLAAVLYSEMGKTFVLHGPPGTGKSQTITNMIAHNLAKGRRVLFVSEKKAALDVVRERLDRIGLTPFCLELHSNKTEKRRFYAQIKEALDVPETAMPAEWDRVAADISKCRLELDRYVEALHREWPNGLTAYGCFSRAIGHGGEARPELIGADCLTQTRASYMDSRQTAIDLLNAFRSVSEEALKTMPALKLDAWSPVAERRLKASAEALAGSIEALIPAIEDLAGRFGMSADLSARGVRELADLAGRVSARETIPGSIIGTGGDGRDAKRLAWLLEASDALSRLEGRLSRYRLETLKELDLDGLARRMRDNRRSFFVLRFFRNRALLKELSSIVKTGAEKLTVAGLKADLDAMREYLELEKAYREKSGCETVERVAVPAALKESAETFAGLREEHLSKRAAFMEFADEKSLADGLRETAEACAALLSGMDDLRGVIRYRNTLSRAKGLGVGAFADYIVANDDGAMDAAEVFDDSYAAKMLEGIVAKIPVLAEFTGLNHEERIERFRALDRRWTALAKRAVFAKLAAALPRRRGGPCPDGTELGMLKRECEKKTRQKAVRQMLAESTTLIPALKPCFLMSPLSVAQYLPVDSAPFDLVVFDEASQIPVWDAIGVIARGKQLVVVGDPKQMPPTNFFMKGDAEEDLDDCEIADQESILDECLVAGVFSTYLDWHYRSRHESLIAFSNGRYYANKLCTFPAASGSPRLGVKFMFVDGGFCEKAGRGPKVNRAEAAALVDYICSEVKKPGYVRRSVGVVTFSMPQQALIRTMIEERRAEDPEIERLLPEEGPGAYFVKNLENVQGDESDVILFSVGFAPDEDGRFAMNFGPLNRSGGERRLNVAVTRAREQVVVFSSVHSTQIDAGEDGRTKSVGAEHLKAFLEYAERGPSAGRTAGAVDCADGFAGAVAGFLESKGFRVERNVGCSKHRIDVAVCDPSCPGRYILGVECDGPSYAGQRTAQDRDVNRAGVLKGLGWNMCRVWSLDWAYDRKRSEERLLARINSILRGEKEPEPEELPEADGPSSPAPQTAGDAACAYRPWTGGAVREHARFYDPAARREIAAVAKAVLAAESPVCEGLLRRRIANAWGVTRITENAAKVLDACMPAGCTVTHHPSGNAYWAPGMDPSAYEGYRTASGDPESRRALDEIPLEEIANAMDAVLRDFGECDRDALYRETVKAFGLSVLTAKARRFLDAADSVRKARGRG
ncbi:MAG: DUF3320 domain-containing protein [Kiritimatiellae bacterium]|nr:DUF3320 domain-containing protein [Kiritimatiellia bacterium]